jgi:hypothetical protein
VKNKNKRQALFFIFILLLLAGFFGLKKVRAEDSNLDIKPGDVIINEVMWMGSKDINNPSYDGPNDQWIELKNVSGHDVNMKGLYLTYKSDANHENNLLEIKDSHTIKDAEYFLASYYTEAHSAINVSPDDDDLNNFGYKNFQIKLYLNNEKKMLIDTAGDGGNIPLDKGDVINFYSMERNNDPKDGSDYDNWHTCLDAKSAALYWDSGRTERGTPGGKNSKEDNSGDTDDNNSDNKDAPDYSGKIKINEIYPSPDTSAGEKEFIEVKNLSDEKINLKGWSAADSIHTGKPLAGDTFIESGELYSFQGIFYLNTPDDTAKILDENKAIVDSVNYIEAKSKYSYAYDSESSTWRWTSKKTPGAKNEFDKILSGKIKKDEPVYVNIYANFSVDADSDAEKFTWDFGDGHKSYIQETKHRYEDTGNYDGSLKITGNGEASEYFFTVKVEKYSAPKVRVASFSPNPKGVDTKHEWIILQNKSKKKVNLQGWSVAMGWDSLVNHPIREDFILKPGKSKKLTQKICAFSLNNTKTKIELRDPSGKVVQKIKYDRTKNKIEEDETYQAGDWIKPPTNADNMQNNMENNNPGGEINNAVNVSPDEIQASVGKFSEVPDLIARKQNKVILLGYNTKIKTPLSLVNSSHIAGASTERNIIPSQKHWVVKLLDDFWTIINSDLNRIINKLSFL